jgi:hypothetical protein
MWRALSLVVVVVTALGGSAGCGRACRGIETKPLALDCDLASALPVDIHFDDAATFETFLETQCLSDPSEEAVRDLVDQVDFTTDVVFVSLGNRQQRERCIAEREADTVEVCDDGLRVGFADKLSEADTCSGKYTVAFTLSRADMRAATGVDGFDQGL